MKSQSKNTKGIKILSLMVLTLQNAALSLSMRYSRTTDGVKYITSTAVVMSEVVKLFSSLFLVYYTKSLQFSEFIDHVYSSVVKNKYDTLKVGVVCVSYTIQNNLIFMASDYLDAATLQVTYQLKILTTAVFVVMLLRRSLTYQQWFALVTLLAGIGMVQLSNVTDSGSVNKSSDNRLIGMLLALTACILSGFGGVYFEKMLKASDVSMWMRNVQLSALSIPVGLIQAYVADWTKINDQGFFGGYTLFVIYLVFLQAYGGLLVAVVVKYADNILKGFATSLAIIISSVLSIFLFGFAINAKFIVGALMVMASVFLYNVPLQRSLRPKTCVTNAVPEKIEV